MKAVDGMKMFSVLRGLVPTSRRARLSSLDSRPAGHCGMLKLAAMLWLAVTSAAPAQTAVEAWVQRYGGQADANDDAQKVVTDNAGNVIVAGSTDNRINAADFLIIKYSGAGVP